MTVREMAGALGLEILTGETNLDRQVTSGYTSDLLSDVIANVEENAAWITIQRHINILGVAKLRDVSVIVIPRGLPLEQSVIDKAREEQIALLRGRQTAFELSALIYNLIHKG